MMTINQQFVVVIGGSSGIGYEVARQTSAQGARLIGAQCDNDDPGAIAEEVFRNASERR
jgi:NAD(P)-dependent dehydrogenase (short-subunit alcohol dehydrogenase family)